MPTQAASTFGLAPDPQTPSPTSTKDPSDPGQFRLQTIKTRQGRKARLAYKYRGNHPDPNSRRNRRRLADKNTSFGRLHARDVDLRFDIAQSRNAVRRLNEAEAAQRARPPPPVTNAGAGGGGGGPRGPGGGGPDVGGNMGNGNANSSTTKSTRNPPINLQIPITQAQFLGSTTAATNFQIPDFLRFPPRPSSPPPIPSAATIQSLTNTGLAQPWVPNDPNHPPKENNVYYLQASQLAAARLIPLLPPGIPPTDMNFMWDRAAQRHVYAYQGDMFWWSQADWKWHEVDRWPDTPANRALGRVGTPKRVKTSPRQCFNDDKGSRLTYEAVAQRQANFGVSESEL